MHSGRRSRRGPPLLYWQDSQSGSLMRHAFPTGTTEGDSNTAMLISGTLTGLMAEIFTSAPASTATAAIITSSGTSEVVTTEFTIKASAMACGAPLSAVLLVRSMVLFSIDEAPKERR